MKPWRMRGAILIGLLVAATVFAQPGWSDYHTASSVSGQFNIRATGGFSRLMHSPEVATNAEWVCLDPTLVAVSAERIKSAVRKELGLSPGAAWQGKIFVVLHPASSLPEPVFIRAQPFLGSWQYRLEMPDIISRHSFTRSFVAVLLIEQACRDTAAAGRSAEIPAWLADGLARQILFADSAKIILSAPAKTLERLTLSRQNENQRGLDPLAAARQTLLNSSPLTFQQLSWPEPAQLSGADGGIYFASAQLFVSELLRLHDGPARLRAMLAQLPGCENWQTAFFAAFHDDFRSPLDVEKWWSLRVVNFAARDAGPRWTPAVSQGRLAELLSVPVEVRRDSNSLPTHAEITLQAAVQTFAPAQQDMVLRTKLRDLELAQLRFASVYAPVVEGYRLALADFLGERKKNRSVSVTTKHGNQAMVRRASVADTVKKLEALDARRRAIDAPINARPKFLR